VVPAPHPWQAYVDRKLAVLLDPLAGAAGLVGLSEFNLGEQADFRVPDGGYVRGIPNEVFVPTAAIVVEVLSPHDETWEKFGHYARHGVEELCIVDPPAHRVRWFRLAGDTYRETDRSDILGVTGAELEARIDWPG
jgi:Uma2 family endonuclease